MMKELYHHGVKGMKWGVINEDPKSVRKAVKKLRAENYHYERRKKVLGEDNILTQLRRYRAATQYKRIEDSLGSSFANLLVDNLSKEHITMGEKYSSALMGYEMAGKLNGYMKKAEKSRHKFESGQNLEKINTLKKKVVTTEQIINKMKEKYET